MDELFGNLIYLLPIALIIVRIISAAGDSKKKKPPQSPPPARSAETPQRVPEQGMDPGMREFLKNFGVEVLPAPPAAPKPIRKKVVKEKPKKEPAKAQATPLFAEAQNIPKQAEETAPTLHAESAGPLPAGLSPLQQGFLWAEILGPAKAMQD
jgi:hypothetical protein